MLGPRTVTAEWSLDAGPTLILLANLGDEKAVCPEGREGVLILQTVSVPKEPAQGFLPPWYVGWFLKEEADVEPGGTISSAKGDDLLLR